MARLLEAFDGAVIYVDAMVIYGHLVDASPWRPAGRALFLRASDASNGLTLVTSALTIDEVVFNAVCETVAQPPYDVTRSRGQHLQRRPDLVRAIISQLKVPVSAAMALMRIEPVVESDVTAMLTEMSTTGLLPRDAIHLSVMRRLGISAIASDDDAFDGIDGITLYKP